MKYVWQPIGRIISFVAWSFATVFFVDSFLPQPEGFLSAFVAAFLVSFLTVRLSGAVVYF